MEITQKEINALAYKVGKVTDLLREMNDTAFRLAKEGNRNGVFQLRGAFSGTLAPEVEYLTWPIAISPVRPSNLSAVRTSLTSPIPFTHLRVKSSVSADTIPQLSCPRCWRLKSP